MSQGLVLHPVQPHALYVFVIVPHSRLIGDSSLACLSFYFMTLTLLKSAASYFVKCPLIWVCPMFPSKETLETYFWQRYCRSAGVLVSMHEIGVGHVDVPRYWWGRLSLLNSDGVRRFFHCWSRYFPFVMNKYVVRKSLETRQTSCFSSYIYPLVFAFKEAKQCQPNSDFLFS